MTFLPQAFKRPRLLIVGCGDIGLRVVKRLRTRYRLLALVTSAQRATELRAAGVLPLLGNLDVAPTLARLAGLADAVLHLAPPAPQGRIDAPTTLSAVAPGTALPPAPRSARATFRGLLTPSRTWRVHNRVVGAGAVGVEFASMFHAFGSSVTMIEALPRIAPLEDEEISAELEKSFRRRALVPRHIPVALWSAAGAGMRDSAPRGRRLVQQTNRIVRLIDVERQIHLVEDLLLAQSRFKPEGENRLASLAAHVVTRILQQIFGHLLRDRRSTRDSPGPADVHSVVEHRL